MVVLKNVDIIHAKNTAFSILMEKGNFIHSIDHALRVHDNAMLIFMEIRERCVKKMISLKLASYWHDTGKDDCRENEDVPHNIISAELFKDYAVEKGILNDISEMAQSIILCHRNRGKKYYRSPSSDEEKVLWDADKLDIVNSIRITEIVWAYLNGYKVGEFNLKDTISFWMSISPEFANKFYFKISQEIFYDRYSKFRQSVEKIYSNIIENNIYV